ncbi:MAG: carboxylating nicotinate-nucleotide diphosphorylase [Fimbriimonadaceae bacterium]
MRAWQQPEPAFWTLVVDDAMQEDVGSGDLTAACFDPDQYSSWYIEAQAEGILCGVGIAEHLLSPFAGDPEEARLEVLKGDGERVFRGDRVVEGSCQTRQLLMAERTVLNLIMHLSGVATLTAQYVNKVEGTRARILDTRKTLPGLRALQKYAVRCGGGHNHRMGLFDGAMIKDNHIRAVGSITEAVERVRGMVSHMAKVEVECENLEQIKESIDAGAEVILLDNMDPFMMREAVKTHSERAIFEASGGISLETVRGVAQTGVDLISVGALTHSAPAIPFHLEVE